ncbi:MAG: class I SAM-dependent methyltransferase [Bacteroidetes bacterium]|nr:class I SAM-dependent methyltransferase [Bacteroidota bacterium]
MKKIIKLISPPLFLNIYQKMTSFKKEKRNELYLKQNTNNGQDLEIYWTQEMSEQLEVWGKHSTWIEIECLLVNCRGKVLDIACGTGVNIKSLSKFPFLEVHGFDISDMLLNNAKQKGINPEVLKLYDATNTGYDDNQFDYSYSIGSLEHFTENGIDLFLKECARYTSKVSFHMIPLSENNLDYGWIKRGQSYFNNSIEWWLPKFKKYFSNVYVINSGWKDEGVSVGKWFICYK